MNAVVGCTEVVNLNNNSDNLDKVESIANVTLEGEDWLIKQVAAFNIPLSIFHYEDYNSDFFTS